MKMQLYKLSNVHNILRIIKTISLFSFTVLSLLFSVPAIVAGINMLVLTSATSREIW